MKRIEDYNKTLPILELYAAIQSEGSRQGMPTIVVRTTGCTHRCYFGEGGWCDSWQTSIHPEKGEFSINHIVKMYDVNPNITEMMLTGGSPTMHPALVNELTYFARERGITIRMETEGSKFVETDYPIGLISLSPKFSNTIPIIGVPKPNGELTDERMVTQHNKFRLNMDEIEKTLAYHSDYHYKPVWDGTEENMVEIEAFRKYFEIPKSKTWLMPAGDSREQLVKVYGNTMNKALEMGYCFTGRAHIICFDKARFV